MNRVAEYKKLNEIALPLGVVIFGEGKDTEIPASEIKASFELDYPVYNRSFSDLNLDNAFSLYCECISMLLPDAVFLHLGENDKELFDSDETSFELKYLELLKKIKLLNRKTRIIVISVDNERINKRLKYIAVCSGKSSSVSFWIPLIFMYLSIFASMFLHIILQPYYIVNIFNRRASTA